MKRMSNANEIDYNTALKRVNLVERNVVPCGVNLVNKHRSALHESQDIIELAKHIQRADENIRTHTSGKLAIILDQIRMLQMQAKTILTEMDQNNELNHVPCNFIKKPGQIYHLYEKSSGIKYFSLLSPEDWNGSCKDKFVNSFRYENDLTWTPFDEIKKKEEDTIFSNRLINSYLECKDENILAAIAANNMSIEKN
ncbi:uncharacterized protein C1orf50 homolog [Condylostylus longicornis]|uniref:uncharacterized protein C1orf50 homolog n=1 Tax=Condylostylus longicornis TaxID=2530218 RepID=UPI00244DA49F|nr:uncharacterized protein C1orf50 homolog [Condylostylus longicornis]